jgi:hypothetical protein
LIEVKGGTMEQNGRLEPVRNLGAVYNDAWDDEALRARLIAEPRPVLAEHGIQHGVSDAGNPLADIGKSLSKLFAGH